MYRATDIRNACVGPEMHIAEALAQLERAHKRILLVLDTDGRLLGVVTDSNFRRAKLAQRVPTTPLSEIMTRSPVVASPDMTSEQTLRLMERTHCHELPVVDADGRAVGLIQIEQLLARREDAAPITAVIMAGGLGERLRPMTEQTPKPLLPVGNRPILFTLLDQLIASRCDPIYIAVNYMASTIVERVMEVPRYRQVVRFLREEERLGTMGAIALLPERPSAPFIVTNADLLTKVLVQDMVRVHQRERNIMTVALREEAFQLPYGVVTLEGTRITGLKEKPTMTHFINAGVYVLDPSLVDMVRRGVRYDATMMIDALVADRRRVGAFVLNDYWIDIGLPHQLEKARQDFAATFGMADSGEGGS